VAAAEVVSIDEAGAEKKPGAPPVFAARSTQSNPTRRMIEEAAWRHGLPPAIVHAVAQSESAYNQKAVSPVGAIGVMQLMPYTPAALGANPRDEAENIDGRHTLPARNAGQIPASPGSGRFGRGGVQRRSRSGAEIPRRAAVFGDVHVRPARDRKYERMAEPETFQPPPPVAPPLAPSVADIPVPQVDRPTIAGLN